MTDAITRISELLAELQTIGCTTSIDEAAIVVRIHYPAQMPLDEATAKAVVEEIAVEPPKPPAKPRATETRKRDHSISPITGAKRRAERGTVDYAEVARVAREAFEAGRPMQNAVAERFGIEKPAASMRIRKARDLGHEIPARNPNLGHRQDPPRQDPPRQDPPRQDPPRTPLDEIERLDALADADDD